MLAISPNLSQFRKYCEIVLYLYDFTIYLKLGGFRNETIRTRSSMG